MRPAPVRLLLVVAIALLPWAGATAQAPKPSPDAHGHKHDDKDGHKHDHDAPHGEGHVHAPVPPEYKSAHLPAAAWTSERLIARGKEIYATNCAVCHGEQGDGNGPAAGGLPLKPPSFRDAKMVNEMTGNYWFWRVSEGGLVEPFKSMGSVMPAWKGLSVEDRWAVIAYTHRLSGHEGPHVVSEHPQMLPAGHGDHAMPPAGPGSVAPQAPPTAPTPPTPQQRQGHGSHKH